LSVFVAEKTFFGLVVLENFGFAGGISILAVLVSKIKNIPGFGVHIITGLCKPCIWSIVTLVLSYHVSEILQVFC